MLEIFTMAATLVLAAPPQEVVLQGSLTGKSGASVDGAYDFAVSLYDAETGGVQLWKTSLSNVPVADGVFSLTLTGMSADTMDTEGPIWVAIKVGVEPELKRQKIRSAPMSLLAQRALDLACTGCVGAAHVSQDLLDMISSSSGATALIADHAADPAAHHARYTDKEAVQAVVNSGLLSPGGVIKAGMLPPDALDEVSGNLISTTFLDVFAAQGMPKPIADNNPIGTSATIQVPDVGFAETLEIQVKISGHSDLSELQVFLYDPQGTEYVLFQKTNPGTTGLDLTFPTKNALVKGDLSPWIGKSIAGSWHVKAIDSVYDNNTTDGKIDAWEIRVTTVSNQKLHFTGDMYGDGNQVKDLAAPTDPADAATKAYVDASFKDRVFTKEVLQLSPGQDAIVSHGGKTSLVFAQAWFKEPSSGIWSQSGGAVSSATLGSGANGIFKPTSNTTLAGGTYEYTHFEIPTGVTVTVTGAEPLIVKAQNPVVIAGTLDLSGKAGTTVTGSENAPGGAGGGAGGYNGGDGAYNFVGQAGQGPGAGGGGNNSSAGGGGGGGGHASNGQSGSGGACSGNVGAHGSGGGSYNTIDADMLKGGSGGGAGGYGTATNAGGGGGGGGGGAVKIVAPTIKVSGTVNARGGKGGDELNGRDGGGGGGGAGGSIWLVSGIVDMTGGTVTATGGAGGQIAGNDGSCYPGTGGDGSAGRIRIDATAVNGVSSPAYLKGDPTDVFDSTPLRIYQPDSNTVAARNLSFVALDVKVLVIVP